MSIGELLNKKYKETLDKKNKLQREIQVINENELSKALKEWKEHVEKITTIDDYKSLKNLLGSGEEEQSRFWQLYTEEQTLL
jgi:transposase